MHEVKGPGFVRFLYNQNPFYLISAAVILYGLRTATQEATFASNPWFLAGVFAGYTTLLALTAWVIVRFGRVWDDARSIFLVLLLLFMALSTSFDGLFVSDPTTAIALALTGFAFAVLVSESLVWSLGIRFRALFRCPLYAMFAISFFYPYLFSLQASLWPDLDTRLIILAFPFFVSASILSLIPAIRRTRIYAAKNGTPWNWPLYPYSIFFLAIVGLIGRTVMLGLSFDPTSANGMLGTWMFVPIFLSVVWLIFEIGTAEGNDEIQFVAMLLAPLALALSVAWPVFSNADFYQQITAEVGSPVWLTLLSVVAFYFVAWIEKIESAGVFLTFALGAAAFLQRDGVVASGFSELETWPCLLLALSSVGSPERFHRSSCWFLSACCMSVPIANTATPWLASTFEPLFSLAGNEATIAANVLLLFSCLIVCIFAGKIAKQLKVVLAILLSCIAALTAAASIFNPEQAAILATYECALAVLSFAIFACAKSRLHLSAAAVSLGTSLFVATPLLEVSIGHGKFKLALFLAAGLSCFLIGLLVSAIKAGWMRKFSSGVAKLKLELLDAFPHLVHD